MLKNSQKNTKSTKNTNTEIFLQIYFGAEYCYSVLEVTTGNLLAYVSQKPWPT